MSSNEVQTKELEDLVQRLRNADVRHLSAPPAPPLPLQSLDTLPAPASASVNIPSAPPMQSLAATPPSHPISIQSDSEPGNASSPIGEPVDIVANKTAAPKACKAPGPKKKAPPARRVSARTAKGT